MSPARGNGRTVAGPGTPRPEKTNGRRRAPDERQRGYSAYDSAAALRDDEALPKSASHARRLGQLHALLAQEYEAFAQALADEATTEPTGPEPWIGVAEAAAHLGKPTSWIYRQTSSGRIPHVKTGQAVRFKRSELDAWLESGGAQ